MTTNNTPSANNNDVVVEIHNQQRRRRRSTTQNNDRRFIWTLICLFVLVIYSLSGSFLTTTKQSSSHHYYFPSININTTATAAAVQAAAIDIITGAWSSSSPSSSVGGAQQLKYNVSINEYIPPPRIDPGIKEGEKTIPSSAAINLHKNYPLVCNHLSNITIAAIAATAASAHQVDPDIASQYPFMYPFMDLGLKNHTNYYWSDHRPYPSKMYQETYTMNLSLAIQEMIQVQQCLYTFIDYFWVLAQQYNIKRWAAHGGTAMATYCHSAMNPWDDDIDITVDDCDALHTMYNNGRNISDVYPDLNVKRYTQVNKQGDGFTGRLIENNNDWIIIKGDLQGSGKMNAFWKLKSVRHTQIFTRIGDLSGVDIMCFDRHNNGSSSTTNDYVSPKESETFAKSGFDTYLKDPTKKLQIVPFGPTFIQIVPLSITEEYSSLRYGRRHFCDYPYNDQNDDTINKISTLSYSKPTTKQQQQPKSSQMHVALGKWYISQQKRNEWLSKVGNITGAELTKEIPNLNHVEIDNTIANTKESCKIGNSGHPGLKVIGFNAERGKHWLEFADMVKQEQGLQHPDIIILNEMDIGMARSGNVHTARKLAYELNMNYAWGLEFVELTRGDQEETESTVGLRNSLGLHGNAILSKCKMYDPLVVRTRIDDIYFSNETSWVNANGYEKRLGGRMAMFVRTGMYPDDEEPSNKDSKNIIVSSVHKVGNSHQKVIFDYFGEGFPPLDYDSKTKKLINGTDPPVITPNKTTPKQTPIIAQGDLTGPDTCQAYALHNLDMKDPLPTFKSNCAKNNSPGYRRGDFFCGNMPILERDVIVAPCYSKKQQQNDDDNTTTTTSDDNNSTTTLQIADHAITQITVKVS